MQVMVLPDNAVQIVRYADCASDAGLLAGIDRVFFEASNTQTFASDDVRQAFRERWLGRYLTHDPGFAYVALARDQTVAGYLVASLDDPARTVRFADISYFSHFAHLTALYPAHLHVNLGTSFRNCGIGGDLIKCFLADASAAGVSGVHIVTSRGARNAAFYNRNGFREAGAFGSGEREIVFLARTLDRKTV